MDLLGVRTHVIEMSGRFDLIDPLAADYTPNTANHPISVDFFIETGQKVLDDLVATPGSVYTHEETLAASNTSVYVPDLRVVHDVWTSNSDGVKAVLRELPIEMLERYGSPPFTGVDTGRPIYYYWHSLRKSTALIADILTLRKHLYILPVSDGVYTLSIKGQFYTPVMSNADDVNWWSLYYPFTLVQSALYAMERFYRNTQGMTDHMAAIQADLQGIDFNMAEDAQGTKQYMRNSW